MFSINHVVCTKSPGTENPPFKLTGDGDTLRAKFLDASQGPALQQGLSSHSGLGPAVSPPFCTKGQPFPRKHYCSYMLASRPGEGSLLGGLRSRQGLWLLKTPQEPQGVPSLLGQPQHPPAAAPPPHTPVLHQAWISASDHLPPESLPAPPQVVMGLHLFPYFHTLPGHTSLSPYLPGFLVASDSANARRPGFDPWVRKISWRRKWQPTPVFLPGKSHG